jgi:hypothetical protein
VAAGNYEDGKTAYVGIVNALVVLLAGRIQVDPPGIWHNGPDGSGVLTTDSTKMWYLKKDRKHRYGWVDSHDGESVPFAIDIGTELLGDAVYIARVVKGDRVFVGYVPASAGYAFYVDDNGFVTTTATGYEVLTCKSRKCNETDIPLPKPTIFGTTYDTGCSKCHLKYHQDFSEFFFNFSHSTVNNWVPYNNDNAPAENGISAGQYDCDNEAYVGKAKAAHWMPGRIQTGGESGFYATGKTGQTYLSSGSFYLADNPSYNYYWQEFKGTLPSNAVQVRSDVGALTYPVVRAKIDGKMTVGFYIAINSFAFMPSDSGNQVLADYELLLCDPIPKYQCGKLQTKM